MYKILMGLFALAVLTNPLSVQFIQPEVMRAWDFVAASSGWAVTAVLSGYLVFLIGWLSAKAHFSAKSVQQAKNKKAKARKNRNLDGMRYETV